VHIYGTPQLLDDGPVMRQMLEALVINHEQHRDPAWKMALPEDYLQQMMQSIVAFEIPIERIEGKFKLSQNRSEDDQESVISHLVQSDSPLDRNTAQAMAEQHAQKK
jgi:transcriptional regulator